MRLLLILQIVSSFSYVFSIFLSFFCTRKLFIFDLLGCIKIFFLDVIALDAFYVCVVDDGVNLLDR